MHNISIALETSATQQMCALLPFKWLVISFKLEYNSLNLREGTAIIWKSLVNIMKHWVKVYGQL